MKVTKEWLAAKVQENPAYVIGRALAAIYQRQTASEQQAQTTRIQNGIGFSKPDARIGCIGARQFLNHNQQQWVIDVWLRKAADGLPRICKYAKQLNDIAKEKEDKKVIAMDDIGIGKDKQGDIIYSGMLSYLNDNAGDDPREEVEGPYY